MPQREPGSRQRKRGWLSRLAGALLLGLLMLAALAWTLAQPWWSPAGTARVPCGATLAQWLRKPELPWLGQVPTQWIPWAALTLDEPDALFTRRKMGRLERDAQACQTWLAAVPATLQTPLPDYAAPGELACGWQAASRISQLDGVRFSSPFTLSCGAAVALARWQRHTVQAAAREHLNSAVVRIEHLGSYACRNISGVGQLSTHANSKALDIAGFRLADGRSISVLGDWSSPDSSPSTAENNAKARFLRDAHQGACRSFNAVLGPEYNAAHRNHFHLDRGLLRACR